MIQRRIFEEGNVKVEIVFDGDIFKGLNVHSPEKKGSAWKSHFTVESKSDAYALMQVISKAYELEQTIAGK